MFGEDFSTCQESTTKIRANFGANYGTNFGENFGNFVSNFAIFFGNFVQQKGGANVFSGTETKTAPFSLKALQREPLSPEELSELKTRTA